MKLHGENHQSFSHYDSKPGSLKRSQFNSIQLNLPTFTAITRSAALSGKKCDHFATFEKRNLKIDHVTNLVIFQMGVVPGTAITDERNLE